MEDRKMFELKPGRGCNVCGDNNEWGFEFWDHAFAYHTFSIVWGFEPLNVCQRCFRQHDQIDVRLREHAARLVEVAERERAAGRDQEADWLADEAAKLRFFIGRVKAPTDADWKALEVEIEAQFIDLARLEREEGLPIEPPEADAEYDDPAVPSAAV